MLIVELLKYKVDYLYNLYMKIFGGMLRQHEYDTRVFRITGASWVLIGDILSISIFPKYIAIGGMLLLSLSDSISGVIGQMFAKKYYSPNRSYLGSFTFIIIGIIIVSIAPKYYNNSMEYVIGYTAVLLTSIADSFDLRVDDNLVIPITFCAVLYVLYLLFFPVIFTYQLF